MTLTSETKYNKKALAFLFKLNHCALPRRRREENHLSLWEWHSSDRKEVKPLSAISMFLSKVSRGWVEVGGPNDVQEELRHICKGIHKLRLHYEFRTCDDWCGVHSRGNGGLHQSQHSRQRGRKSVTGKQIGRAHV